MSGEKTVSGLLEEIEKEICDNYCKYPEMCADDDQLYDEYCAKCPLNKIG